MNDKVRAFKQPLVRQLAWACFSPPLIADFSDLADKVTAPAFELHEDRYHRFMALDADPSPLQNYLAENCRSQRLGLVFESLWHFFLQNDPETELIAHNLPIRDKGKTLGELDVLYFCHHRQRAIHLELAVKYFMATEQPAIEDEALSSWLGPNSRDRLDIKWQRMLSHQLALVNRPAAQSILNELAISELEQEVAIKGWLFHHCKVAALSENINPLHERGLWYTRSQFLIEQNPENWLYLVKPDWLADEENAVAIDDSVLALSNRRPVMLINTGGERIMLTPDHWPDSID